MRSIGIPVVTILFLVNLTLVMRFDEIREYFSLDRPAMKLPTATNQTSCCKCFYGSEMNWTKDGVWVNREGKMKPHQVEGFLKTQIEKSNGRAYTLRLRIPADARAEPFMMAALAAQRAGVSCLHVAVVAENRISL